MVSFGDWEGYTLPELKRLVPERLQRARREMGFHPARSRAESYESVWRVGAWAQER